MRRPITAGATPSARAAAVRLPLVATATKRFDLLEPVHGQQLCIKFAQIHDFVCS
jgi:hypothetical protein